MLYLIVVSFIWAFSFGLIKTSLAGVDPIFIAAARLGLALLVFLPFLRIGKVDRSTALRLVVCGAVQYGAMYIAYLYSFRYLQAYQIALFTILTPLYVTLIYDFTQRRVNWVSLGAVTLAIAGTWISKGGGIVEQAVITGFLIVQLSNLFFAFGQVEYRRILAGKTVVDGQVFALPYLGGFLTAGVASAIFTNWSSVSLTTAQATTLVYLGVVASGLCFFLWNVGARRVNAGTLAIFNDLKIPLAAAVSLIFFGESADLPRLLSGGGLAVAALLLNEWAQRRKDPLPAVSTAVAGEA
jgi:drug/metabolite transporter (DMT)-like permease